MNKRDTLGKYGSVEEFINKNRRYPNQEEWRNINSILWNQYINNLSDTDKKVALDNDNLCKEFKQDEIIKNISRSAEDLKTLLKGVRGIISVDFYERWGDYRLFIIVNCLKAKNLYLFRKSIPNYFEGWYVELSKSTVFQSFLFYIKKVFNRKIGK